MKCPHCGREVPNPVVDRLEDIPTREAFDEQYANPNGHGEEGEWILISGKYSQVKALKRIREYLKDNWGVNSSEDYWPKSVNDLQNFELGWATDPDSYHHTEGTYWIVDTARNNLTARWNAWGIATQ